MPEPNFTDTPAGYIFLSLAFLVGVFVYCVPILIGYRKKNAAGIVVLTILAGWTVIGWIAALIWAATADHPAIPSERMPSGTTDRAS